MQCVATLIITLLISSCKAENMAETLDISKQLDDEMFRMEIMEVDGCKFKRYSTKRGFIIAKVIQDYNFIWQRLSYRQQCKFVDVYIRNDKPFLIYMQIVKTDEEINLYFMNTISTWTPITFNEFMDAKDKVSGNGLFKKKKGSFLSLSVHYGLLISLLCSIYAIT